ncbi:unnamed protein product [Caenorhabditis bovis]|uniref:Uncharacterized protein n=1 Tax=Caenorhabditis bovis TaxID=2654633 RepID=A0A8S1ESM5_9PELO|nr:unnamed protein product [Caenorhabditis bovis]
MHGPPIDIGGNVPNTNEPPSKFKIRYTDNKNPLLYDELGYEFRLINNKRDSLLLGNKTVSLRCSNRHCIGTAVCRSTTFEVVVKQGHFPMHPPKTIPKKAIEKMQTIVPYVSPSEKEPSPPEMSVTPPVQPVHTNNELPLFPEYTNNNDVKTPEKPNGVFKKYSNYLDNIIVPKIYMSQKGTPGTYDNHASESASIQPEHSKTSKETKGVCE